MNKFDISLPSFSYLKSAKGLLEVFVRVHRIHFPHQEPAEWTIWFCLREVLQEQLERSAAVVANEEQENFPRTLPNVMQVLLEPLDLLVPPT